MSLHLREVRDVANMFTFAVHVEALPAHLLARQRLDPGKRFQDRERVTAPAAYVVDLATTRLGDEHRDEAGDVVRVDVVPHLLALVAEHAVQPALEIDLDSSETMQLDTRVVGPGQTACAQAAALEAEVPPVLLHHHVAGASSQRRTASASSGRSACPRGFRSSPPAARTPSASPAPRAHLAISPTGEEIVFGVDEAEVVRNTRSTRLWRQSTRDRSAYPLTTGHGSQRFPQYSPDGRLVAFVATGNDGERLLVVDAGGGKPQDILPLDLMLVPSEIYTRPGGTPSFVWSPDSRSIACLIRSGDTVAGDLSVEGSRATGDPLVNREIIERLRGGPPVRLCVANLVDREVRFVGDDERPLGSLSWSPDGQHVFAVSRSEGNTGGETRFSLIRYSLRHNSSSVVTTFDGASFSPRFSPGGNSIVVAAARGTSHAPSPCLLHLKADDETIQELSTDDHTTFSDVHWNPDGASVVAIADTGIRRRLLQINVSTGDSRALPNGDGWIEMLRASDNGDVFAFMQSSSDDPGDVWTLNRDDMTPRRLTEVNPHLSTYDLARGERFQWKADDGTALEGVVLIHRIMLMDSRLRSLLTITAVQQAT